MTIDDHPPIYVPDLELESLFGGGRGLPQPQGELLSAITQIVGESEYRQFPNLSPEDEALRWLQQSREPMGWKCPAELATQPSGVEEVLNLAKAEFSYERPLVRMIKLKVHDGGGK